ncbi:hypothetical protein EJ08DRAFT_187524 [Tothia fuscella]|uniref:Uncharacterized protein n=1 Tax=Tothia fuscella TaxID=1048955 RepID=A0A9P4TYH4_9PEZI|nr:hypothetical protein EJ08DRAFT_187524 [Tothia fuscella]
MEFSVKLSFLTSVFSKSDAEVLLCRSRPDEAIICIAAPDSVHYRCTLAHHRVTIPSTSQLLSFGESDSDS